MAQVFPDGSKVYFLSNGRTEYGRKQLACSCLRQSRYNHRNRFSRQAVLQHSPRQRKICYISNISKKSELPRKGRCKSSRSFIDTLPSWKRISNSSKETMRQVTEKQSVFSASFSPMGSTWLFTQKRRQVYLALTDTAGKVQKILYLTHSDSEQISFIYSIDWSPDGKSIAFSYFEKEARNIRHFDTLTRTCRILPDSRL